MKSKGIKVAGHDLLTPETLVDAVRMFADESIVLTLMATLRWPDGKAFCQRCGLERTRFTATRGVLECRIGHSQARFSIKTGTVMEDSPMSLDN